MSTTPKPEEEPVDDANMAFDLWLRRSLSDQYKPFSPVPDELLQVIARSDLRD